ncbi:cyclophilin-like fold protein [Terrilactibacillus sp. S3-3]|nr:cyclophilin-like fold protein [Terrilactibacillus sp. S3-3]
MKNAKIRLTFNNQEIVMNMRDNPTTRDLLKRLPLTLKFEDYSGAEKIGHLSHSLTTSGAPSGRDPSVGDIAFYAPWGNIALYYHDVSYYDGIIPMGYTNPSEMKKLEKMKGDFNVRIERID